MSVFSKRLISILKILVSFSFAIFLFWYLYKDGFSDTIQQLKNVNYLWVLLSLLIGMLSHIVRAYRWRLLLIPTGQNPSMTRSLYALMVGYLFNLAVPRLGELSRCLVLKRTDQIPVTSSLGTVVSERVLDVLTLLLVVIITLLIEFEKLSEFFEALFVEKASGFYQRLDTLAIVAVMLVLTIVITWVLLRSRIRSSKWWQKLIMLARQTWEGFISITRLTHPGWFWAATAGIWILYFFASYVVFFAMEPTSHLGWRAGLALLVMGGLGMSAPVQGGIGAFHLLVAGLLVYYGVSREDGLSFAFLLHSSQMLLLIFAGSISGLIVLLIGKKASKRGDTLQ